MFRHEFSRPLARLSADARSRLILHKERYPMKSILSLCLALLAAVCLVSGYSYAHSPNHQCPWQTLMPGFEYRAVPLRTYEKGVSPVMHQVRVDPKLYKFNLVLAKDYKQNLTTVSNLRKKIGALCAVNASFFDEHCDLLGYHSVGQKVINSYVAEGNVLTGILTLSSNYCNVWDRDSFNGTQAEVAIQCGPRLIVDGKPTKGLHGSPARLSGCAIDNKQRVILFATSMDGRLSLNQCQELLAKKEIFGGVTPRYAINFDGGSSTGFSLETPALSLDSPSLALIPSVLAITKR